MRSHMRILSVKESGPLAGFFFQALSQLTTNSVRNVEDGRYLIAKRHFILSETLRSANASLRLWGENTGWGQRWGREGGARTSTSQDMTRNRTTHLFLAVSSESNVREPKRFVFKQRRRQSLTAGSSPQPLGPPTRAVTLLVKKVSLISCSTLENIVALLVLSLPQRVREWLFIAVLSCRQLWVDY